METSKPNPNPSQSKARSAFLGLRNFLSPLKIILLCLTQLIDAINTSGVNIALPDIAVRLGLDEAMAVWIIAAYSMTFGSLMLISGRIGDVFGFRNVFIFGLLWFGIWSIICGIADNQDLFIVARALQGLGASATIPNGLALIVANYEGKARDRAIGAFGASSSLGFTVGLIIGGAFANSVGYQWIFYMSAIVAGVQALLTVIIIPDDRETNRQVQAEARQRRAATLAAAGKGTTGDVEAPADLDDAKVVAEKKLRWWQRFDYLGAFLITASLFFLVFFLTEGNSIGWSAPINIVFIVLAAVFASVFVVVQVYQGHHALMPLAVWKIPNFAAVFVIMLLGAGAIIAMLFWFTQLWQYVRNVDALETSIQFLPMGVVIFILTPVIVILLPKVGMRWMLTVASCLELVGCVLAVYIDSSVSYWSFPFASIVVVCAGFGGVILTGMMAGMVAAPPEWRGLVSALLNVAVQVGAAVCLAITTAIASGVSSTDAFTATPAELTAAYHAAFWSIVAMCGLNIFLAAIFTRHYPMAGEEPAADTTTTTTTTKTSEKPDSNDVELQQQ